MSSFYGQDKISENKCGTNLSFILNDNNLFSPGEYKKLKSQENQCLVKCLKIMYNNNIQLYYQTSKLISLTDLINSLDAENFLHIVANFIRSINEFEKIGYLSVSNIDITFEHIYVDQQTNAISLIYLPIETAIHEEGVGFEMEVRNELLHLIDSNPQFTSPEIYDLRQKLSEGRLNLETILKHIKVSSLPVVEKENEEKSIEAKVSASMKLIAINHPNNFTLNIMGDSYVIGRKPEYCDGVIDFNHAVSGRHCRVLHQNNHYLIEDLGSSNGTKVNGEKLMPNTQHVLSNNDHVTLANAEFKVVME